MSAEPDFKKLMDLSIDAWQRCSKELEIVVEAPFYAEVGKTRTKVIAYLPHFGTPNGLVIGPYVSFPSGGEQESEEQKVIELAKQMGASYSLINLEEYSTFSATDFAEALADWGFCGPDAERPVWLR